MKKKSIIFLIQIIILGAITLSMVYHTVKSDISFTGKQYIAIGLYIAICVLAPINTRVSKFVLLLTLILGTFNIVSFYSQVHSLSFFFQGSTRLLNNELNSYLQISMAPSLLLVFFIATNLNSSIFPPSKTKEQREAEYKDEHSRMKMYWKEKLSNRSIDELEQIATSEPGTVQEAAKEAAIELLNNKQA